MDFIGCHACAHKVSTTAETCPKCGAKLKKFEVRKRTGCLTWAFVILAIAISMGVIIGTLSPNDTVPTSTKTRTPEQLAKEAKKLDSMRESYARVLAEKEIRARLKAPRGAKFSGYSETEVGKVSSARNEFIVTGYVDAENSFGAMLRSRYRVLIEFEEGKYDSSRTVGAQLFE